MTGYQLAEQSALLLQDRLLLNALQNEQTEDEYAQKIFRALRDALSEVSRDFPVLQSADVTAKNRTIPYSDICSNGTVCVKRVVKCGRDVPFTTDSNGIYVRDDGNYTVVYSADCFFADLPGELPVSREVSVPMLAHLTARNYCIMCGRPDEAVVYDSRYDEYAQSLRIKRRAHVPARKFV
ncbi:MAG: hypothetical protein J1F69_00280 [Clostridiales bacterium]|nr:hypothetical protein [Clostridiales bacterium]